jgi:hypothetical protein
VSNALITACGTPTSGSTITTCTAATITGIAYKDSNAEMSTDGTLEVAVPEVSVSDPNSMMALIAVVAGAFQSSSEITANSIPTQIWPDSDCGGYYDPCTSDQGPSNVNMTTVNSIAQALYTIDLAEQDASMPTLQNLQAVLAFSSDSVGKASCSKAALAMDSLAAVGAFLDFIGLIPGFEWVEALGDGLTIANAALAGGAEAVSLTCEITESSGGE